MSSILHIVQLQNDSAVCATLADLLVQTVAHGGSVGFMHPLAPAEALAFWDASLAAAGRGERIVLGAYAGNVLVGTVTVLLACPPNQPHRAEIAKMMTHTQYRHRGIARQLMQEAERLAMIHGKTLLNLDTAEDEGAAGLYEKLGFHKAGVIPDFALKPHGGLTGTILYWKRIGKAAE